MIDRRHLRTDRPRLDIPRGDDLAEMHEIYSDPRVWTHFPTLRHTYPGTTRTMLAGWSAAFSASTSPSSNAKAESRRTAGVSAPTSNRPSRAAAQFENTHVGPRT